MSVYNNRRIGSCANLNIFPSHRSSLNCIFFHIYFLGCLFKNIYFINNLTLLADFVCSPPYIHHTDTYLLHHCFLACSLATSQNLRPDKSRSFIRIIRVVRLHLCVYYVHSFNSVTMFYHAQSSLILFGHHREYKLTDWLTD